MKRTFVVVVVVHPHIQNRKSDLIICNEENARECVCVCACALRCPCRPIDSCMCRDRKFKSFSRSFIFLRFLCMSVRPAVSQSLDYELVRFHSLALPSPFALFLLFSRICACLLARSRSIDSFSSFSILLSLPKQWSQIFHCDFTLAIQRHLPDRDRRILQVFTSNNFLK